MLASVTRTAPFTCLRCQFRQVIFGRRRLSPPPCTPAARGHAARGFNTSTTTLQDDGEDQTIDEPRGKDEQPRTNNFRISKYGQHGRGHRETSARLKSTAMGKPFEVTVLHDLPEENDYPSYQEEIMSTDDAIAELNTEPLTAMEREASMEEVMQSIEALRPNTEFLDNEEIQGLAEELRKAYNTRQLSKYLKRSLRLSSLDAESVRVAPAPVAVAEGGLKRTAWQPGTTPIDQRHSRGVSVQKRGGAKNKSTVIAQILRLAWKLQDLQAFGEMEVHLKPWQMFYLFNLEVDGKAMHQKLINNSLLQQRAQVQAYTPDSIMRITAPRLDAEDVVSRIEVSLSNIITVAMDTTVLEPLLDRTESVDSFADLWEKPTRKLAAIWDEATRQLVGRRTTTSIDFEDDKVVIYGSSRAQVCTARSLLLSWLALPYPGTTELFNWDTLGSTTSALKSDEGYILPSEAGDSELPLSLRASPLGRLCHPVTRASTKQDTLDTDGIPTETSQADGTSVADGLQHTASARILIEHLSAMNLPMPFTRDWEANTRLHYPLRFPAESPLWHVEVCRLLQRSAGGVDITKFSDLLPSRSVRKPQLPHASALLSNLPFAPFSNAQTQYLVAHFVPSPFAGGAVNALQHLPRLAATYYPKEDYALHRVSLRLCEQEVQMPLPGEAVDLCFFRGIWANFETKVANSDLKPFTELLKQSAEHGKSALETLPSIKVRLPGWLAAGGPRQAEHTDHTVVPVEYLFDRFEWVQSQSFGQPEYRPLGEAASEPGSVPKGLNNFAKGLTLAFRDIDGGLVGGHRNMLMLKPQRVIHDREDNVGKSPAYVNGVEDGRSSRKGLYRRQTADVVYGGLMLARAYTRLATGVLRLKPYKAATSKSSAPHGSKLRGFPSEVGFGDEEGERDLGVAKRARPASRTARSAARTEGRAASSRHSASDSWATKAGEQLPRTLGSIMQEKVLQEKVASRGPGRGSWRPKQFYERDLTSLKKEKEQNQDM